MKKEHDLCSGCNSMGCNKCLLSCPTYSNYAILNSGSKKINIDNAISISHGLFIMINDRVASYVECSIDKLFADLKNGKKISLIVIPSIMQSIPNYKRLFSYLKIRGVNLIYDGSFGADIMLWGNNKIVKTQNIGDKIVNPCQIMVSYAEHFEPQLIQYFVPIQTPAVCTAIYLDKYMGVTDSIAVLSACIYQTLESNKSNAKRYFEYNFTFDEMLAYLAKQCVDLSEYEEISFDSVDSSYEGTFSDACVLSDSIRFFLDTASTATPPIGIKRKLAKERFIEFDSKLKLEDFARNFMDKRDSISESDQEKIEKLSSGLREFISNSNKSNCFLCGVGNCAELAKDVALGKDYIVNSAKYKYTMMSDTNEKLASRDQWFSAQNKLLASKNKELLDAIEYTRIVEDKLKLEKSINDFALQNKYELIALIDVFTGAFTAYKMSKIFQNGGLHNKMGFNNAAEFVNQNLVHEDDRDNFKQQNLDNLLKELDKNGELFIEYRLLDAETNNYRWKRVSYRYFDIEKKCVIQLTEDIHKDMVVKIQLEEQNEKLLLNDRCFKALSEHTNKVVFEWDFATEIVTCMSNFKALFGREAATRKSPNEALSKGYVHIDDKEAFERVFDVLRSGEPVNDIRFRVLDAQNKYRWCSLSGIVIKDDNGNRYKAIGILESIAKQLDKEEKLRKKAERDQLTGVYNKITSEMLIKNIIADSDIATSKHALLIIDIDNYKNINDKFGHLYGDFILAQLSLSLNSLFRETDVVGRLGGDEFFVFIKNYSNENVLIEKSKEICKVFHKSYFEAGRNEKISASIGIAKFPEHGQNFETLYRNADIALYGVKMHGKNSYKIYNGEKDIDYISDRTDIDTVSLIQKNFMENRAEYVFRLLYETSIGGGNINSALQFITEHFGFSRGYIFETDSNGECTNNTYEWCADGISSEIDSLQNIPIECINTANNAFIKSGVFVIDDISTMPKIEREVLERQGIKSMFQFGIMVKDNPIGFIGFDDCVNTREPSDVDVEELKLICNIFATFIIKQRSTEIAELNYKAIRSILDNFEGYAYVVDKDNYKVVFENIQISAYLGESSVGKPCYEQYMSRTSPCNNCPIKGLLNSKTHDSDKRFLNGTARYSVERQNTKLGIYCRTSASIIKWSDGKEKYLMSNVDISKYKKDKKDFKDYFGELLSLTKIGTWDWNIKTGEVTFSKEWAEILGYSLEELKPQVSTWKQVVFPSDLEYATEQMALHLSGQNTFYESELRMVRKDGEIIWAQDKGCVIETDEDGNPIRFIGGLQDLSRLKYTEIELINNQEALDLAMNIAELGTWDLDIVGNRVTYNDDYLNMIGLTQNDVDGSIEGWESSIHPEDLPRILQLLKAYLAGDVAKYECETRLKHRDGHYIWTRDVGRIVSRDAAGKPTRLIGGNLNIDTLKRTQEQLNKLAYYDELTGAPNLTKFKIECQRFVDENKDKKLLMVKVDLQEFKLVNQVLGEKVGDKVIISLAKALKTSTPGEYERYARLHDDEFLVLHEYNEVEEVIEIRNSVQRLFYEEMGSDFDYDIKMVSGHYYMTNDNCYNIIDAIEKANIAHGLAKKQHLEICVYSQDFTNEALKKMMIESRAPQALKNKEFKVYLQPKYELLGETIVGAEALVRWIDGAGVIIYPDKFIPIFEHNRFITQLDFYMFEESCKIIRSWIDNDIVPVPISVNFSRLHLFNSEFANTLANIADKYGISHHYLEIELTETIIMETEEKLNAFISSLHEQGFLLSIDDFGTGYSSLGMLKNFNVDIIKLDRSFFVDANKNSKTHSILSNMLNMIIDLGIKAVAEGVEDKEHVDLLRKLNCDIIQGYYFSKPIPNEQFTKKLNVLTDAKSQRNSERQLRFNLRKNNELLTEMMDYMPLAFTLWDNRLDLVQCNKAAVTLLGYGSEEELIANNLKTMPKYQADGSVSMLTFRSYIHKALESGYEECKTWNMLSATGVIIPCEIIFVKIINKGKFMVACYIHDISLLIKSENIIKQEHLKLEKMMDASPLCFNLWDEEMHNTMCNKAAPELFDLPNEKEYLKHYNKLSPLYQPDGRLSSEKAAEKIKMAFANGKEVYQWMHQKLNGELIPTEITLVRIELNGKQVVAGFTRDLR